MWSQGITFDPVLRQAVIAGAVLALLVLTWFQARRTFGTLGWFRTMLLFTLRLALVLGLALILMRPMKTVARQRPATTPIFSILVDRSGSMQTEDATEENAPSRADLVSRALSADGGAVERELRQDWLLKTFGFSDQPRSATLQELAAAAPPDGPETNIASALLAAGEGNAPHAGVLLLSDGRANAAGGGGGAMQAARFLASRKIPVWTVTVGRERDTRDAYVTAQLSQNFLYARQPGSIDANVDQTGYKGWPATVRLKREGVEVDSKQVILNDGPTQCAFAVREDAPGLYQYAVELDPMPGEADRENNRRAVFARVTDRRTQVLVVEAAPSWDSKFMVRALRKDVTLDVTSFFQLSARKTVAARQGDPAQAPNPAMNPPTPSPTPHGSAQATSAQAIPRSRAELFAYDVIVLGQGADRVFGTEEQRLLKDYLLERGGSLIFSHGKAYGDTASPLADLEPVVWGGDSLSDKRIALTDRGRDVFSFSESPDLDLMFHELPPMLSVARVREEKTLAVPLARVESGAAAGPETDAVIWQHYGKGKVVSIGNSGLWRWSLVPDNAARYQGVYEEFWSQLVRWLVASADFLPNQDVTFDANRNSFQRGEQVRLSVRTRLENLDQYHPTLEVNHRDGGHYDLQLTPEPGQPGVFGALFTPEADGEYKAILRNNIGEPREDCVRFTVYEDQLERRLVSADPGLMNQIARLTGGEVLELDQLKTLPGRVKRFEQASIERREPVDAWDRTSFFYLLAALLGVEWFVRRAAGLV